MINYSIIIPHKNIPKLLQRCLDSIPVRDDVQVIVVDDNGDLDVVDFSNFPQWSGENYETYFSKTTLFAGGARNVGMQYARGTWIVYLDADDLFTPQINAAFDKYKSSEADYIRFRLESRDCDTMQLISGEHWYNQVMQNPNMSDLEKCLDLTLSAPAFYKRSLLIDNGITWGDNRYHNDTLFVTQVVLCANHIVLDPIKIYIYSERVGSISRSYNHDAVIQHFETDYQKFKLVKSAGISLTHLGNYQMEHFQGIRGLTIIEQIPIIWKMWSCGMLFNKCAYNPIPTSRIVNKLFRTLYRGGKNTIRILFYKCEA
jgi:glycosyltransferase involved in cell wall biosynthesis